jgi:hypothetical protein
VAVPTSNYDLKFVIDHYSPPPCGIDRIAGANPIRAAYPTGDGLLLRQHHLPQSASVMMRQLERFRWAPQPSNKACAIIPRANTPTATPPARPHRPAGRPHPADLQAWNQVVNQPGCPVFSHELKNQRRQNHPPRSIFEARRRRFDRLWPLAV